MDKLVDELAELVLDWEARAGFELLPVKNALIGCAEDIRKTIGMEKK